MSLIHILSVVVCLSILTLSFLVATFASSLDPNRPDRTEERVDVMVMSRTMLYISSILSLTA